MVDQFGRLLLAREEFYVITSTVFSVLGREHCMARIVRVPETVLHLASCSPAPESPPRFPGYRVEQQIAPFITYLNDVVSQTVSTI